MLEIRDLAAAIDGKPILHGHRPDGAGGRGARHHGAERVGQIDARYVLAGREDYEVTAGSVTFDGA